MDKFTASVRRKEIIALLKFLGQHTSETEKLWFDEGSLYASDGTIGAVVETDSWADANEGSVGLTTVVNYLATGLDFFDMEFDRGTSNSVVPVLSRATSGFTEADLERAIILDVELLQKVVNLFIECGEKKFVMISPSDSKTPVKFFSCCDYEEESPSVQAFIAPMQERKKEVE